MSAADEIHVVLSDDVIDAEVMRYRLPSSTEQLVAAGEHDCDGDGVLVLVREPVPKRLLPHWRRRLSKAIEKARLPSAVGRGKLLWDSVGAVLLVLQVSSLVLSSIPLRTGDKPHSALAACPAQYPPDGTPTSGGGSNSNSNSSAPDASSSASHCLPDTTSSSLMFDDQTLHALFNIHLLVDLYFIIDLLVRYRWNVLARWQQGRINNNIASRGKKKDGQEAGEARVRVWWLVIDVLLLFPFGVCWKLWEARPALQLLTMKEERRRPILDFFFNRSFRLNVLKLVREHRAERKVLRGLFPWLLPPPDAHLAAAAASRPPWMAFLAFVGAKTARVCGFGFRLWRRARNLSFWSTIFQLVSWLAMTVRALSRLSPNDFSSGTDSAAGAADGGDDDDVD